MTNKKYTDYLRSKEWAEIRLDIFETRGRKCERCDSKKFLNVHHKSYDNIFNEEPSDLEVLCRKCHEGEHGVGKPKGKKKYRLKKRKKLFESKARWYNLK